MLLAAHVRRRGGLAQPHRTFNITNHSRGCSSTCVLLTISTFLPTTAEGSRQMKIYLAMLSLFVVCPRSAGTLLMKWHRVKKFVTETATTRMCMSSDALSSKPKLTGKGLLMKRLVRQRSLGTVGVELDRGTNKNHVVKRDMTTLRNQKYQQASKLTGDCESKLGDTLYISDEHVNNVENEGSRRDGSNSAMGGNKPFSSLNISANTKKAIEHVLKYETMSQVQQEAIPAVLSGVDVFAKAKTGTGKTLAFLIPGIDMLLKELHRHSKHVRAANRQRGVREDRIEKPLLLILSPTRELAMQIAAEAKLLLTYHKLNVITTVGGVAMTKDLRALNNPKGFDIIVATPGRFLAHLQETPGVAAKMKGVKFLVLDEADRLLDMGFSRDINKIASYLPSQEKGALRQTFLFSATFSNEIKEVARVFLRRGYTVVDTVGDEVEQTHLHVPQSIVSVPTGDQVEALKFLLESEMSDNPNYKIMVFFPTARQTGYMAALFRLVQMNILEIHSRKSQSHRSKTSETFRKSTTGIVFTSDVTARGMDYPDVSLVVQMGMTQREQYIHRLGRTARAGKEGSGVLVVHPNEYRFMNEELSDMPLKIIPTEAIIAPTDQKPDSYNRIMAKSSILRDEAKQSWQAWLGFYNGQTKKLGWSTQDLLREAKSYAKSMGLDDIPALPKRTLSKMGLAKAAGFKSEDSFSSQVKYKRPR